jgi:antitoxin (DNA-binding transcriptional repressor) of toxin-antitoxin stability system
MTEPIFNEESVPSPDGSGQPEREGASGEPRAATVYYAKTHLSRMLREVELGYEYVVTRGDAPVARLVPISPSAPERTFGAMRGRLHVPDASLEPLPEHELDAWGSE